MTDKANALRFAHGLWQRTWKAVKKDYPDVETDHLYVDVRRWRWCARPSAST